MGQSASPSAIRAAINPGRALTRSITSQVLDRPTSRAPISPAPTQNVFQQSADALRGAQDTYGRLSRFTPQQITADTAPAATVRPAAQAGPVTVAPAASYGGATVGDIERIQAAQLGPAREMSAVGAVRGASAPGQIAVDQLQSRDIQEYMNPFQDQVINPVADAIERQRRIAQEDLEGQAARTQNFGSRLDLERDRLAEAALRQTGQALSPLYQQGFGQAMQARQFDVGQTQQARILASNQAMEASRLQQQADEAGAAREQAARAGNMRAANQFAQIQANLDQRSAEANQRAQNTKLSQDAQFAQQANLQSMQAANDAARQQAQIDAQIELANIAAQNRVGSTQAEFDQQAIQADLNRTLQANTQNAANQIAAAGQQRAAAGGLSNVAQQALSAGQQVQAAQSAQGALQRGLQQQLINNAQAGGQRYLGAPAQGLNTLLGTVTGAGVPNTAGTQTSFNPGLFNYLQVASQFPRIPGFG